MTDTSRPTVEALIARLLSEDGDWTPREAAEVLGALLTERDRSAWAVRFMDENFPCDGGCNANDGPAEECSRDGRSPRDLWEIIGRVMAERDAARAQIAEADRLLVGMFYADAYKVLTRGAQDAASVWSGHRGFAADEVLAQDAAEPSDGGGNRHEAFEKAVARADAEPWTDPEPWLGSWGHRTASEFPGDRNLPRTREQWEAEQ